MRKRNNQIDRKLNRSAGYMTSFSAEQQSSLKTAINLTRLLSLLQERAVLQYYLHMQAIAVLCSTHFYVKAINYTNPTSQVINNLFLELISTFRIHQYLRESWNIPFWYASSHFSHVPQNILLLPMFFFAMSLAPSRIRFKDLQLQWGWISQGIMFSHFQHTHFIHPEIPSKILAICCNLRAPIAPTSFLLKHV